MRGYRSVRRVMEHGAVYVGTIAALQAWYRAVRRPLMERTAWGAACFEGALRQLAAVRKERIKRMDAVVKAIGEGRIDDPEVRRQVRITQGKVDDIVEGFRHNVRLTHGRALILPISFRNEFVFHFYSPI